MSFSATAFSLVSPIRSDRPPAIYASGRLGELLE
jgi:hypothetical protein